MAQRRLLAWTVTAVALALLLSANGVESRRRSQKEQSSVESSEDNKNNLQRETEELLEYGSKLRWQIVDMLGKMVYDRYDEMTLSQLEVLYKIYHETLRRKLNIFEIASSLASKSDSLNVKDVCEVVNEKICTSEETSKVCSRLAPSDSRRSTNATQDIPEVVKKQFPRGVTIPAVLKEIRDKKIKITPKLLAGLITNIQYDSFDNEVLRAEKTLVDYLHSLPDSTVFSPGNNLHNFVSLDLLLKALLEHNNNQFPGPAKRAAIILIDHFEKDLNSINNNIEHFGIIYENSTINLKYLFDLVIPDDLVDTDIIEARDNLEKAIKKDDFVKNNLSIDKYRHATPDQLVLEILRQLNHVGQKVDVGKNILKALRMHADFWRKERTIDDVSDFLMLFNAYDNLRDKPEYKKFFQYVNLIKEKLKHSENVNLELTCNMPRPCLRRVLLKILECDMVDDETKKIVSYLIKLLNSRGTPIIVDRKVPDQLIPVPQNQSEPDSLESVGTSGETDDKPIHPPTQDEFGDPKIETPLPKVEIPTDTDSIIPPKLDKPLPPSIDIDPENSESSSQNTEEPPKDGEIGSSEEGVPKPLPSKCEGAKDCIETTGTTNLPLEESTLPSKGLDISVEEGTTENSVGPEITKRSSEIVDETTTIIPSKTTTSFTEITKRKFPTEEVLSTTPTIPKPNESTTPASVLEHTIIGSEEDGIGINIPSGSLTGPDGDASKAFEECFNNCLKDSNEEKCEESCEKSIEGNCQGPNCPDISTSIECESGSGEDCSTESSSTTGTPSQSTSGSNTETSVEDCSDSNSENCKKPLEKCEGPNCPTTAATCEGGNCTEEPKPSSAEIDDLNGPGVICDGLICKPKDTSQSPQPQGSEEVNTSEPDIPTEPSSVVDENEGKLCDTKDPHRQRKSERLKKMRRLNVIDAEEQALNLYDEGDGPENVKQLKNQIQEDKQGLGPLLQGLTKTEEDKAKHNKHQSGLRRSLSSKKDKNEKLKIKIALKRHLRRTLDSEKQKINNQKDNSKIANRRSEDSKVPKRRSEDSKVPNRRSEDSKIPKRRSEDSKVPKRRSEDSKVPKRRSEDSKAPKRRSEDSKVPKRRSEDSKVPKRRSEDSKVPKRRSEDSKAPKRRSEDSKVPNKQTEESKVLKRRSEDSKVPNRRSEDSKVPNKQTEDSKVPKRRSEDSKAPKRRSEDSKVPNKQTEESKVLKRRSEDSKVPNRRSEDSKVPNRRSESSTVPNRRSEDSKVPNRRSEDSKVPNRRSESSTVPNRRSEDSKVPHRRSETSTVPNRRSEDSKVLNRRSEDSKVPNRRKNSIKDIKESSKNDQE